VTGKDGHWQFGLQGGKDAGHRYDLLCFELS
jgi:hypothetical protein